MVSTSQQWSSSMETGMIRLRLAFGAAPRPGELIALAVGLRPGYVCFADARLAIAGHPQAESAGTVAYGQLTAIRDHLWRVTIPT